jgi:hypothetical protein
MKRQLLGAIAGIVALAGASAAAADTIKEERVTEKTTTFKGVVSEMPDSQTIVLESDTGNPMRYTFNEKTTFVDENGNVVSRETIRNRPVTIHTTPGGSTVVTRVVVGRPGDTTIRKETHVEERRTE